MRTRCYRTLLVYSLVCKIYVWIKPTLDVTEDEFEKCINLNIRSLFHSVGAVMPLLVQQKRGAIVNG